MMHLANFLALMSTLRSGVITNKILDLAVNVAYFHFLLKVVDHKLKLLVLSCSKVVFNYISHPSNKQL